MSAQIADAVSDAIRGQVEADRALDGIRAGTAHPDEIHTVAMRVWSHHGTPGLTGFHRRLQKALERSVL